MWRSPAGIELGAFLPLVLLYGALAQRDDTLFYNVYWFPVV
jgi:hypothetical protein